jgi:diguanylate cyclase (GGDEF)-like protein
VRFPTIRLKNRRALSIGALMATLVQPVGDHSAAADAARLGVIDALVFRRIGSASWAHVGGLGRGQGWAGIIDINENDDALAIRIPAQIGGICRAESGEPDRIIGPYYAAGSAVVRVTADVVVVLGSPEASLATVDDVALLRLAIRIDTEITDVGPSKRLADELEVLTAVRAVMETPVGCGLTDTLRHLTEVATRTLTCEVGELRPAGGNPVVVAESDQGIVDWPAILDEVESNLGAEMWCSQDMVTSPSMLLARQFPTARSVLAVPVPAPIGGCALFVHTASNPRGFSRQCRRLVADILETGMVVAGTAAMRDELRRAAETAVRAARTDPLTGLGNRLAWDEAIGRAQEAVDAGATYSVVSIDVDGLKEINDRYGHGAGDDLLRRCSDVIRKHCSTADLAVRMGGDEFAILVPHALGHQDETYRAFSDEFSALRSTRDCVAASLGVCTVDPGSSVFDAIREADMHMYGNKRRRRRERADAQQATIVA